MSNASPSESEFSFDLYPGLDADLQAAYTRNLQQGNAVAEEVAMAGIADAVNDTLSQIQPNTLDDVSAEASDWAKQELESPNGTFQRWSAYQTHLGVEIPKTLDELAAVSPNLGPTVQRLYEAKQALTASGEVTPAGQENIGETMNLVVVPWQAFRANLGDIAALIKQLRNVQGIEKEDYIGSNIMGAIVDNVPFYRSWDDGGALYSADEYLRHKIEQDGPWGVMLAQTSDEPGAVSLQGQSPDEMTGEFNHSPEIAGQAVGSMGFFEWQAVTLQGDPRKISSQFYTWMLANRIDVAGVSEVAYGRWRVDRVGSRLWESVPQHDRTRPRLAVM